MIRPLRQRHRRTAIALAICLPVLFAWGIAARKPVPSVDAFPQTIAAAPQNFAATGWADTNLFDKLPVRVSLLQNSADKSRFAVKFSAPDEFLKPDLIVYWIAGNPANVAAPPAEAQLLGAFNTSTPLELPSASATQTGALLLYSLADGETVGVSKPALFSAETK
jgi:hypothetical protein